MLRPIARSTRDDPAGLANNGGPTQTIALEVGSPAINAGDNTICAMAPVSNIDQRGWIRPGDGAANCSIGAYEFNSNPAPTPTFTPPPVPSPTPAVACAVVPRTGCQQPQRAAGIVLNTTSRRVSWKWLGSATPVAVSQFGDPANGLTSYHLCVYGTSAGLPSLAFSATVPTGGFCDPHTCWKRTRSRFSYTNTGATPDGVTHVVLQPTAGRTEARITLSGRGSNLRIPLSADGIFLLPEFPEVIVQLQRSDSADCWESVFTSPPIRDTQSVFTDTIR